MSVTTTNNQPINAPQITWEGGEPGALPVDAPTGRRVTPIASPGYIPVETPAQPEADLPAA